MPRALSSRVAAAALLTATTLSCSDATDPTSPAAVNLTQAATKRGPTLTSQSSGTTERLIGVHAVNQNVAWVSGTGGTFAVTTDGGATWHPGVVPGAEALQFRDVEGVSAKEAYLLSIGPGSDSRIYHTSDGGATWDLQFQNTARNLTREVAHDLSLPVQRVHIGIQPSLEQLGLRDPPFRRVLHPLAEHAAETGEPTVVHPDTG